MSVRFPLESFFQSSGNAAAQFAEDLRDEVVTFACELWSLYPNFLTQNSLPATAFARGFMNSACSPIQPPVTAPTLVFTGGQCPGTQYNVEANFDDGTTNGTFLTQTVVGPVDSVVTNVEPLSGNLFLISLDINARNNQGDPTNFFQDAARPNIVGTTAQTINVIPLFGGPNNCGDPPVNYQSPTPTSNDLTKVVNITNLDGLDNQIEIKYNKVSNNYNFPMGFKINGTNVVLDLSGLTIFGNVNVTTPTTPANNNTNDPPPPGSDGGNDGVGGDNDTVYDTDYPAIPDITVPETALEIIEWLVCMDGVISTITDTLKIVTGNSPLWNLIIDLIGNLLEELCGDEGTTELLAYPEWWNVRPGTQRPVIVYIFKELIANVWGPSSYESSVFNPRQTAIDDLATITSFDKTIGTFVASAVMVDGSKVKASGDTEVVALNNFNFLLNQVDPAQIPANINQAIIISEDQRLQVKTLKLRQVQYYPLGRGINRNPTIKRLLDP